MRTSPSARSKLSIVVPVLNEAATIATALHALAAFRARDVELIVVDGGSADNTREIAVPLCDQCITAPRGRAMQMNAGAQAALGDILLFLHADTALPANADQLIRDAIMSGKPWGRFDVRISGAHWMLPVVAWFINGRSRLTGIATGDQAIFVTAAQFKALGGFPSQPLMEDVELCTRLRRVAAPSCLAAKVLTSGRRWEKHGVWRTIFLMWWLRLRYALGTSPDTLHHIYYGR